MRMGRETGVALPSARETAQPFPAEILIGFVSLSLFDSLACLALDGIPWAASFPEALEPFGVGSGICRDSSTSSRLLLVAPAPAAAPALPDENALARPADMAFEALEDCEAEAFPALAAAPLAAVPPALPPAAEEPWEDAVFPVAVAPLAAFPPPDAFPAEPAAMVGVLVFP